LKLTISDFSTHRCTETESYCFISKRNPREVIKQIIDNQEKAEKWDTCLDLGKDNKPEDYLGIARKCLDRELEKDQKLIDSRKENKRLKEENNKLKFFKGVYKVESIQLKEIVEKIKTKLSDRQYYLWVQKYDLIADLEEILATKEGD